MTIRTPGFEPAAQYSQRSPALRDVLKSPQLPTAAQGEKEKISMSVLHLFAFTLYYKLLVTCKDIII